MTWRYRPDQEAQSQLLEIEKTLGLQNIKDMSFDASTGYLTIFTENKKFRVLLTEFS